MIYSKINNDDVLFFQKAISDNNVFLDDKTLDEYSHDETEDLKFPAIIVEHTGSGFEEQFIGQDVTLGSSSGTGEIYGASYTIHLICERQSKIQVVSSASSASDVHYKQRRLLN